MRNVLYSLLLLVALSPVDDAQADHLYGNATCSVVRVYDGDTFYCDIEGWPSIVGDHIGIRVAGVDTPEMRGKSEHEKTLAREAKAFVQTWLESCQTVELRDMRRGKYFRIVADIHCGDRDLAADLIEAGLARAYDGGKKEAW